MATVREQVFEALDNCVANGYEVDPANVGAVADELVSYDADLEKFFEDSSALVPHVEAWLRERGR